MKTLLLLIATSCALSACVVDRPVPREPDYAARGDHGRYDDRDRDRDHREDRRDDRHDDRDRDYRYQGNMPPPPPPGRY